MNTQNINEGLIVSYIKLLNTSYEIYTKLPQWNKIPTIEELKNQDNLDNIYKKIMITLKIMINKTKENKHDELNHLYTYAHNLLLDPDSLKQTTKLNVILSTAIIGQKILNEKNTQKYQEYMIEYL